MSIATHPRVILAQTRTPGGIEDRVQALNQFTAAITLLNLSRNLPDVCFRSYRTSIPNMTRHSL